MEDFRNILDMVANLIAVLCVVARFVKAQTPRAMRFSSRLCRRILNDIARDVAMYRAMSRKRKIIFIAFNLYVVAALATASAFDSDSAPIAVQAWVATLPLMLVGGWGWLGIRGATRRVRRMLA